MPLLLLLSPKLSVRHTSTTTSCTDCSFFCCKISRLTYHKHEQGTIDFKLEIKLVDASQLAGAYEAMTSSDFPKQPRRHSRCTQQHSSTAAAIQHAAAAVQAVAFVAATVFGLCVQDPQPAASRRTLNPDPTAAAAVLRTNEENTV